MIKKILTSVVLLGFLPCLCLYAMVCQPHSWASYVLFAGVMLQANFGVYCSVLIFSIVTGDENSESMKFIKAYSKDKKNEEQTNSDDKQQEQTNPRD